MSDGPGELPVWSRRAEALSRTSQALVRQHFGGLSRSLVDGAREVSHQGDELFLGTVNGMHRSLETVSHELIGLVSRIPRPDLRGRLGLIRGASTRERVVSLLSAEARRSALDVAPAEFERFADKMGTLFELIFAGEVRIEDIVLENDEDAATASAVFTEAEYEEAQPVEEHVAVEELLAVEDIDGVELAPPSNPPPVNEPDLIESAPHED